MRAAQFVEKFLLGPILQLTAEQLRDVPVLETYRTTRGLTLDVDECPLAISEYINEAEMFLRSLDLSADKRKLLMAEVDQFNIELDVMMEKIENRDM